MSRVETKDVTSVCNTIDGSDRRTTRTWRTAANQPATVRCVHIVAYQYQYRRRDHGPKMWVGWSQTQPILRWSGLVEAVSTLTTNWAWSCLQWAEVCLYWAMHWRSIPSTPSHCQQLPNFETNFPAMSMIPSCRLLFQLQMVLFIPWTLIFPDLIQLGIFDSCCTNLNINILVVVNILEVHGCDQWLVVTNAHSVTHLLQLSYINLS